MGLWVRRSDWPSARALRRPRVQQNVLRPCFTALGALALLAVLGTASAAAAGPTAEGGAAGSEAGARLLRTLLAQPTAQQQGQAGAPVAAAGASGSRPAAQPSASLLPPQKPQPRKLPPSHPLLQRAQSSPHPQLPHSERRRFTNETAPEILKRIANRRGQVILLVFQIDQNMTSLESLRNYAYFLGRAPGRPLEHTLMLVADHRSYDLCAQAGMPGLYLDRAFPFQYWHSNPWYHEVFHDRNRVFDVAKHWHALKVTELGYSVLYTDFDMVMLRDPLAYLAQQPSTTYDVQAQTDFPGPEDAPAGFMLLDPCTIYKLVKEPMAPSGAQMREIWGMRGNDSQTALQAMTPCASTGFWYIRPTPVAIAFQRQIVDRLLFSLPWGWDQVAWNEALMGFLVGFGDTPPLRVRMFPLSHVANVGAWENRRAANLPADPVMIHCGGVNGAENKTAALAKHGLWHPELWDPAVLERTGLDGLVASLSGAAPSFSWHLGAAEVVCLAAVAAVLGPRLVRLVQRRQRSGGSSGGGGDRTSADRKGS